MAEQLKPKTTGRTKLALWLLIGPTGLIIISVIIIAIANLAFSATVPEASSSSLFGEQNPAQTFVNVIMYIVASLAILAWLPALITGIVLLATKPAQLPQ